ncbi:MspI family type II restriction endonuclease [Pseudidiomarina homiensis]|uniref:Type II site-specific deoxyribonuclease n=1 Tax=Pseudidiomarina homiensis TaxID=364198 RepID=A0A432XXS0_9GAMM|nr:MspI family type II restriction endonuclease [Pseudidiomarina homiensis]RUO53487.1 type II site-specific deoxyribonuclease [Pseudidiomarina homiensis]
MTSAQNISNKEKSVSGQRVKEDVAILLTRMLNEGLIESFTSDETFKHRDYSYEKQFKTDFIVTTLDQKFILIRASNSFRSDRAKISFYDFLGIQSYSEFSGDIVASILLFPDDEISNTTFLSARERIHANEFFSPASHWLTYAEFIEFIDNYRSEIETAIESVSEVTDYFSSQTEYTTDFSTVHLATREPTGSYYGRAGNQFEKYLVSELNSEENLSKFKYGKSDCYEFHELVTGITDALSIPREQIQLLEATDTITKLKNLGSPKTDVHLKIFTGPKSFRTANLSIKNTTSSRVSCHDYQAKDFVRVIAPSDDAFRLLVTTFQEAGSWTQFEKLLTDRGVALDIDSTLNQYMMKIIEWAIIGKHDEDNIIDPSTQLADFLLTRNANNGLCKLQHAQDYCNELYRNIGNSRGAPFSWTYPSKRRGERIQLKMPLKLPQPQE